jgi:multidrug efflux pump subunit AcrA (membrane-fusion protein)
MNYRIFIIISFVAFYLIGCTQQEEENVEKAVPVKIYKVKSASISQYIRATGSVVADEDVILYSKVAERMEKVNVAPGQPVKKNQILAEQKNEIFKQGLDIANAALKTAEAQVTLSTADYERMHELYLQKAISPQQYDQVKAARETVEQGLEQAKSMYEQAHEQPFTLKKIRL